MAAALYMVLLLPGTAANAAPAVKGVAGGPSQAKAKPSARQGVAAILIRLAAFGADRYLVRVTNDAIRVDILSAQCTVVSKAPEWNIIAWREKEKTMFSTDHKTWCEKCQMKRFNWTSDLKSPLKVTPLRYLGADARKYSYPSSEEVGVFLQSTMGSKDHKNIDNRPTVIILNLPNGEKSGPALARLLGIKCMPGIPLEASRRLADGTKGSCLVTESLSRTEVDSAIFDIPKGYKKAPFHEDFFRSNIQAQNTNDFFESLVK